MKWITITSPEFLSGEAIFIDKLFSQGLDLLHIRKPDAPLEAYKRFLLQIPKQWYSRIVLHEHFALAEEFGLHGIHLKSALFCGPQCLSWKHLLLLSYNRGSYNTKRLKRLCILEPYL